MSLWLAPDFSDVEKGRAAPPYVNHDTVDFEGFRQFLEEFFSSPERVRIRVPNDTIDQVTVHFRAMGPNQERIRCDDFAAALLAKAKGAKPVIDVRADWRNLHHLKDRSHAPPPIVIMFVVEGAFESVMIWSQQAALRLGIRAADMMVMMRGATGQDYEGKVPKALNDELEKRFGIRYLLPCQLHKMAAHSPMPDWVQQDQFK